MQITTIGLDLAKHWFQVHGVDAAGKVGIKRRLRRSGVIEFFKALEPCLVGMEACATAHHWGRELMALGHEVKLMPPAYVKAYVKRNKNDAADAEAICEAVTRPSMRFVPVKDADQQSVLMMHRARNLLVRQRTMLVNALRAHLAEFGVIALQGLRHVEQLIAAIGDCPEFRVWFGHNGNEGVLPWPDARNRKSPTRFSTSFWLALIRGPPLIRMVCWTS